MISSVVVSMQYSCQIIYLLKRHKWVSMCLCSIHKPWMSIRVFLSKWIYRHGYYHVHCMDTSTRECIALQLTRFQVSGLGRNLRPLIGGDRRTKQFCCRCDKFCSIKKARFGWPASVADRSFSREVSLEKVMRVGEKRKDF